MIEKRRKRYAVSPKQRRQNNMSIYSGGKLTLIVALIGAVGAIVAAIVSSSISGKISSAPETDISISFNEYGRVNYSVDMKKVKDLDSSLNEVQEVINQLSYDDKQNPNLIDQISQIASVSASTVGRNDIESSILIDSHYISEIRNIINHTSIAIEGVLLEGGIFTARYLSHIAILRTERSGRIEINIAPDIQFEDVDAIRIESPTYAIQIFLSDLPEGFSEMISLSVESVYDYSNLFHGNSSSLPSVKLVYLNEKRTFPVTISLEPVPGIDPTMQIINNSNDGDFYKTAYSRYNDITGTIDCAVSSSGIFVLSLPEQETIEEIDGFNDILGLPKETQIAIRSLVAQNMIAGYTDGNFRPYNDLTRGQAITLIMRALGKVDYSAHSSFADVEPGLYFYHAVASAEKYGIVNVHSNNTFDSNMLLKKSELAEWIGNVLRYEMRYNVMSISDATIYLSEIYDDVTSIPEASRPSVALAIQQGLIPENLTSVPVENLPSFYKHSSSISIQRGEMAVILYRLSQRMW